MITGASSGLGKELAILFSKECENLYLTGRNITALENLKKELKKGTNVKIHLIKADLKEQTDLTAILSQLENIDLLINNAGSSVLCDLQKMPINEYKSSFELNYFSHVYLTVKLIEHGHPLKSVVNILSTTAIAGRRSNNAYSAPKAAFWCFGRALRRTMGNQLFVQEVIPATFSSGFKAEPITGDIKQKDITRVKNKIKRLTAKAVAETIYCAFQKKKEIVYIPGIRVKGFIFFEAFAPRLFRRIFK